MKYLYFIKEKLISRNEEIDKENLELANEIEITLEELEKAKQYYYKSLMTNPVV